MAEQETPDERPVGAIVRQLRHDAGLSLTDLATKINYSRGYISKVETGAAPANEAFARRCDQFFGTGGTLAVLVKARTTSAAGRRTARRQRPFDLPPAPSHFVGRRQELAAIEAHHASAGHGGAAPVTLVHGLPGVGKTALVVDAGHRMRSRYPDGCLFLELSSHTPPAQAVTAAEALDRLLRRLGVPGEAIPLQVADRVALYRSLLSDRRVLILLDNARHADQVTPLIPATDGCRVLVTSRRRLPALDAAQSIHLGPLAPDAAAALFQKVAGTEQQLPERAPASAVTRAILGCGGLPLALRTAASRYRATPHTSLAEVSRQLAEPGTLFSALDDGERSVRRPLAAACADLPSDQRTLLALIAAHPGRSITRHAAAWITGWPAETVTEHLHGLYHHNLLDARSEGRFALHDLVRAFALTLDLSARTREVATTRLIDAYVNAAHAADAAITPHRYRPPPQLRREPTTTITFPDRDQAFRWCDTELDTIVAVSRLAWNSGHDRQCWHLAYAMRGFFFIAKTYKQWIITHRLALQACQRSEDHWAQAVTRNNLGLALVEQGRTGPAEAQYHAALKLFDEMGDDRGRAATLGHLAWSSYLRARFRLARQHAEHALILYERHADRRGHAITTRTLALILAATGSHRVAVAHLESALAVFESLDLPVDAAMTLNCLGEVHFQADNPAAARQAHRRAAQAARTARSQFELARAVEGLRLGTPPG